MKEASIILEGFAALCAEGKGGALATVVHVAGSSYRRPGARMLVAGDGRTWGGVSGGCLERDVIRRARPLIGGESTAIARYDTTDEENDGGNGAVLGCAGVIDIFIEPVSAASPGPMPSLRRAVVDRRAVALATVIRGGGTVKATTRVAFDGVECPAMLSEDLRRLLASGEGGVRRHDGMDVFYELLKPPQSLVIFGGGPDVTPLVAMAKLLGWHTTVVRQARGIGTRFDGADRVVMTEDDQPLAGIELEPEAAVVVMTHNYPHDVALVPQLMARPLRYVGVLGPRRRSERLVADTPDALDRIYAPVGLDVGADTPEVIALAIIAEIQAVLAGRASNSLRDKPGPIYARADGQAVEETPYSPRACPISA